MLGASGICLRLGPALVLLCLFEADPPPPPPSSPPPPPIPANWLPGQPSWEAASYHGNPAWPPGCLAEEGQGTSQATEPWDVAGKDWPGPGAYVPEGIKFLLSGDHVLVSLRWVAPARGSSHRLTFPHPLRSSGVVLRLGSA